MMGIVPAKRRGVAAGARTLLQNTGRGAVDRLRARGRDLLDPEIDAVRGLLRARQGLSPEKLATVHLQHARRAVGAGRPSRSLGAFVCLLRPPHDAAARLAGAASPRRAHGLAEATELRAMSSSPSTAQSATRRHARREPAHRRRRATGRNDAAHDPLLRGTRPAAPSRARAPAGAHRTYSAEEVERLREVMRLKELLGLSLEELGTLLAAEEARAAVRAQLRREDVDPQPPSRAAGRGARPHRPPARAGSPPRRRARQARGRAVRDAQAGAAQAARAGRRDPVRGDRAERDGGLTKMSATEIKPSPEGVPGAVTDASGLRRRT